MNSHQQFQQNPQMGSGLTRYRSAPSSYFASLLSSPGSYGGFGADDFAQLFNPRASSPETQAIFSRFMNGSDAIQETCPSNMALPSQNPGLLPPRKSETEEYHQPPPQQQLQRQRSNDYSSASQSQMMYANTQSEAAPDSTAVDGVFTSFKSCAAVMDRPTAATSSLIRHSSSPAGLFANINIKNELSTMRGAGSYGGAGGNCSNAEASFSTGSRLMSRKDYSSRMDPIQEMGSKGMRENDDEDGSNDASCITGLTHHSWDDSALGFDHYYLKGLADTDNKISFNANASDHDQKHEAADRPKTLLSHHLSLPKSSADLLLQDSVPCRIRAKRGCATHPRSIAERVRRTKISERMRKLQELVPNMEKQTNTSDMLDLAVDYIKELQRQVKTLSDSQANCNCSAKKRP